MGGKALWNQVKSGWSPPAEMEKLLFLVCKSVDRAEELQRILDAEGPVQRDRFGRSVPHAASMLLKGELQNFVALYRLLNLESPVGEDPRPGRPDGFSPR